VGSILEVLALIMAVWAIMYVNIFNMFIYTWQVEQNDTRTLLHYAVMLRDQVPTQQHTLTMFLTLSCSPSPTHTHTHTHDDDDCFYYFQQ